MRMYIHCYCLSVCLSVCAQAGQQTPFLVVVTVESGDVVCYDFDSGSCSRPTSENIAFKPLVESAEREQHQAGKEVAGTVPVSHYWDTVEPKLLGRVCLRVRSCWRGGSGPLAPPYLAVVELQPSEHAVQKERKKRALEELASQLSHKYSLLRVDREGRRKVHGLLVAGGVVGVGVYVRMWMWVSGSGCVLVWCPLVPTAEKACSDPLCHT